MFKSTKTYGHDLGISCAFRQWRADSHCNQIHGYALAFKITFQAHTLDDRNWVMDFGGLKPIKQMLVEHFDHKLLVASDDPLIALFGEIAAAGIADVVIMPDGVGCERIAEFVFRRVDDFLQKEGVAKRVIVESVEVMEHGANSAIYVNPLTIMRF